MNGRDCSIVIKTASRETDLPYSSETIRDAVLMLLEEAAIEGDGVCRTIQRSAGVTGCVLTPLTIETAPFLFYLAMGNAANPVFISQTKNIYRHSLNLLPLEDSPRFDLIQDRGNGKRLYESCAIKSFEVRIHREETIKLKLDITSSTPPTYLLPVTCYLLPASELFSGDNVTYKINGKEYTNIYGFTLSVKKESSTKTEVWIKRSLQAGAEIPEIIDELIITPRLLRDKYEYTHFGTFRIIIKRLFLISDETNINSADTVIGPLRYFASGSVTAEAFTGEKV